MPTSGWIFLIKFNIWRESLNKRVAFLATGDEIVNGDLQDTNATYIAQQLVEQGIEPAQRIITSDNESEIEAAIRYLLSHHDALITIGGLGPTLDDRTRFALAKAIGQPLQFNKKAWQWIVELLNQKNLPIPNTNKQQAMFPDSANPIHNPNGTAAGCHIEWQQKQLFMLPGPPNECRPIFDNKILPLLIAKNFTQKIFRKSWLLLGVSESVIAEHLERLLPATGFTLGYRVHIPYLEIKLAAYNQTELQKLSQKFLAVFQDQVVSEHKQTASEQLFQWLQTKKQQIIVEDHATMGFLESILLSPSTYHYIAFNPSHKLFQDCDLTIKICGMEEYWGNKHDKFTQFPMTIIFNRGGHIETIKKLITHRGKFTIPVAAEIICWAMLNFLNPKK